jgi:NAD(P)-dependent dehydrogenase (short-subunit alcohol dehydrogenase family)
VRAAGGAALVVPVDVAEITAAEHARVTGVTYLGVVHGTMAALSRMREGDRVVIVQTGSALGRCGVPLQSAYRGAKHAVKGFTEALHTELKAAGSGVRVTRVDLPGVNTPQFDWVLSRHHGALAAVGAAGITGLAVLRRRC